MVNDKPSAKPTATTPPKAIESSDENERPTVSPPFDVDAFARTASAPSGQPQPPSQAPTNRPPAPPTDPQFEPEVPTERITMTNEVELERARAESAAGPKRTITSSALSIANSRSPSSVGVVRIVEKSSGDPSEHAPSPSSIEAAVLGAIDRTSTPEITERTIEDPVAEMHERFSLGDYTGALEMSELILAAEPDHYEAVVCGENCRTVLENMYAARLGPIDRIPMVLVQRAQMRWLSMDHRAGFVLSLVDGSSTVEMILDVSGMPKLDALRILSELVQQKIVSFR